MATDFETVTACVEALQAKDMDAAMRYASDDVELDTNMMGVKTGKEQVKSMLKNLLNMGAKLSPPEEQDGALFAPVKAPVMRARLLFTLKDGLICKFEMQKA